MEGLEGAEGAPRAAGAPATASSTSKTQPSRIIEDWRSAAARFEESWSGMARSAWLAAHPNVTFHFTLTSASWLNQVEIWFGIFQRKTLQQAHLGEQANVLERPHNTQCNQIMRLEVEQWLATERGHRPWPPFCFAACQWRPRFQISAGENADGAPVPGRRGRRRRGAAVPGGAPLGQPP